MINELEYCIHNDMTNINNYCDRNHDAVFLIMPIEWLNLKFNRKPIHYINCRCQANQKPSPIWWSLKRPESDWNFDEINWFDADNECVEYENIAQMRYELQCMQNIARSASDGTVLQVIKPLRWRTSCTISASM